MLEVDIDPKEHTMTSSASCSSSRETRQPIAADFMPELGNPLSEMSFAADIAALTAPNHGLTVLDASIPTTIDRPTALRLAARDRLGALRVALVAFTPFPVSSPAAILYGPMQAEVRRTVREWLTISGYEASRVHVDAVVVTPNVDRREATATWHYNVMDSW